MKIRINKMINFKDQIKLFTINNDNKIDDIEKINENKMTTVFVIN